MDNFLPPLFALLLGIALGAIPLALMLRSRTVAHNAQTQLLAAQHTADLAGLRQEESTARAVAEASLALAQEQLLTTQQQYRELIAQGKAEHAVENKILGELAPVKESLGTLARTVTALELQRAQQHGEISQQLIQASEAEERLRQTAEKRPASVSK